MMYEVHFSIEGTRYAHAKIENFTGATPFHLGGLVSDPTSITLGQTLQNPMEH